MTKDELLEAIDKEIEALLVLYYEERSNAESEYDLRYVQGKIGGLRWIRDLIEIPPGGSWGCVQGVATLSVILTLSTGGIQ